MSTLIFLTKLSHCSLNCAYRHSSSSPQSTFTVLKTRRKLSTPVPPNACHSKVLPKRNILFRERPLTVCSASSFLGIKHQMSPDVTPLTLEGMKYALGWYAFSMIYSSYNKKLAISSAMAIATWTVYNRQLDAFAVSRVLVFAALLHAFCHVVTCASSTTDRAVKNGRVKCVEALLVLLGMRALGAVEVKAWVKACVSLSAVSLSCALAEVENVSNDGRVIALTASLVVASVLRGLSFREASLQLGGCTSWYGVMTLLALLFLGPLSALLEGREAQHTLQSLAATHPTVLHHLIAWVGISGMATYFSGLFYFQVILETNVVTAAIANVVRPVVCMLVWGIVCRIPMLRRTMLASCATILGLATIFGTN